MTKTNLALIAVVMMALQGCVTIGRVGFCTITGPAAHIWSDHTDMFDVGPAFVAWPNIGLMTYLWVTNPFAGMIYTSVNAAICTGYEIYLGVE